MNLVESIGAGILVVAIAFVSGCLYGKSDDDSRRLTAEAQLSVANGNVDICAASLEAVRMQVQGDIGAAQERAEAAAKANENLVRENMALGDLLGETSRKLVLAGEEPTCREQLEMELCPAVPLL